MIKYILVFFNLLGLLLYQLFFQANVNVTQSVPASANAGSSFVVQVTINKANVSGFAKFQENLPKGFTATAIDKQSATVLSSDDAINFIWASLPNSATVKVSFRVTVDSSAVSGAQALAAKFLYVVNNQKQEADASSSITINGGTTAPVANNNAGSNTSSADDTGTQPAATNNSSDSAQGGNASATNGVTLPPPAPVISVTRSFSLSSVQPAGDVTVSLIIHKGTLSGFAKLEEDIPAGLIVSADKMQGASFTFIDNKAKFVWLSLPADSVFTVSYKISVGSTASGGQLVSGQFSYLLNNNAMSYDITANSFAVQGAQVAATTSQPAANNTQPDTNTHTTPSAQPAQPQSLPIATGTQPQPIPSVSGLVSYRVQIMALHNAVKASFLARKFGIHVPIKEEMLQGFTKYTVGNFKKYKTVRNYREEMRSKGVIGAFVVAYNSGQRITVQEALMITHQQWYK